MSFPWWKVPEGQAERKVSPSAQNWSTYLSPHSIGQNLLLVPCYLQDKVQSLRLSSILYRNQIDYNRKAFFRCSAAQERASLSSSLAFSGYACSFRMGPSYYFTPTGLCGCSLPSLPPRMPFPNLHLENSSSPCPSSRVSFSAKLPSPTRTNFFSFGYHRT